MSLLDNYLLHLLYVVVIITIRKVHVFLFRHDGHLVARAIVCRLSG